eukprot:12185958-Karenia_brevis.AAC.1
MSKAVDQQWRDETWEVVEADLPRQRLWCPQLLALSEPPKAMMEGENQPFGCKEGEEETLVESIGGKCLCISM